MPDEMVPVVADTAPPVTTELQELNHKIPYRDATAGWTVPKVTKLCEEAVADLDPESVSHVVLAISQGRQAQIMSEVGVHYNDGYPFPFWYFIGKILSKALFERDDRLELINFITIKQNEYVTFVTKRFLDGEITDLKAIEIIFKKPQPGKRMEFFWKPVRQYVYDKLQDWLDDSSPIY